MTARIKSVIPDSIADRLGLSQGDCLLALNGNSRMEDLFDYEFEMTGESRIVMEVAHSDGTTRQYHVEKDESEDLGIVFESPVFTPIKTCNNACPFCFIDQQPEGLRASLYVKDDDYRLSYFCNTYITLTNLTRHDRERIERIRPGPLYVSVHSTVPEVRERLLLNRKAGDVMKELRWLAGLDIPFHAQLVICPGINDGESLSRSLRDLSGLRPHCLSVALVPVGLTSYRERLPEMTPMTQPAAEDILRRLAGFEAETGCAPFAFASDEIYIRADRPIPAYERYGDFPQLDDGVGNARLFNQEFYALESGLPSEIAPPRKHVVLTGKLGGMVLQPIIQRLNRVEGLFLDLIPVENRFWGEAVTVAGLVTGQDILGTLQNYDLKQYDSILIPETMLKPGEPVFLDDYCLTDLEARLGRPFQVVRDPSHAGPFLELIFKDTLSKV